MEFASSGILIGEQAPWNGHCQHLCPGAVWVASCLSERLSKVRKWIRLRLLSNFCLCVGSGALRFCACPLSMEWSRRVKPLFPIALKFSCAQTLLALKARCFEGSSTQCRTPSLGSPMWGSTPCLLGRTSAIVIILPFVVIYLAVWVLTIPVFSPPTRLTVIPFLSLVVETLFC